MHILLSVLLYYPLSLLRGKFETASKYMYLLFTPLHHPLFLLTGDKCEKASKQQLLLYSMRSSTFLRPRLRHFTIF